MDMEQQVTQLLAGYDDHIVGLAQQLRRFVKKRLPRITEQVDLPARMIAYCHGQRYVDMICVIIPSKKMVKLGFSKGVHLPDPDGILRGKAKISRYIEITDMEDINERAITALLAASEALYREQTS
jgi:hypothetical protein